MPTALTDDQVRSYHELGFVAVAAFVDAPWLERLNAVTDEFVEASRSVVAPNLSFDLEPDHSSAAPRLRRLNSPVDHHATYWEFASQSAIVDAVCDLIGPDVKFHHSKLNFKAPLGGEEVKWHQDIGFWPHTNYSPLTVGVFLADVEQGMGEVGFVPGSHDGELFDQYDGDQWRGAIGEDDLRGVAIKLGGVPDRPRGHDHDPQLPDRPRQRPEHFVALAAVAPEHVHQQADAFAYTNLVQGSAHGEELIRGVASRWARHDPRPCQVGPSRYRSIFEVQQGE